MNSANDTVSAAAVPERGSNARPAGEPPGATRRAGNSFRAALADLFEADSAHVFRIMNRLSGDADLAADLTQDAFLRLSRRGVMPEHPRAWLITVAMNLFRNVRTKRSRRTRLLTVARAGDVLADPPVRPDATGSASAGVKQRVRTALDRLSERDRTLLLLHAEGYRYREIAEVLGLAESGIGTLLARARKAFRDVCEGCDDAS